jgi:hypothetical protein
MEFDFLLQQNGGVHGLSSITQVMTMRGDSGNVGIGTSTPQTTLVVNGGLSVKVIRVISSYAMTTGDFGILADATAAALTITLPSARINGMMAFIKKIDASAHTVKISRAGTDTIEGATTVTLSGKNQSRTLVAGGNGVWYVLSNAT